MDYIHLGKELNNFKHIILPSYPTNKPSLPIAKIPNDHISRKKNASFKGQNQRYQNKKPIHPEHPNHLPTLKKSGGKLN
ncbi:MAG: hypothetical protein ACLUI9_13805 [[Clostridium] scindens]